MLDKVLTQYDIEIEMFYYLFGYVWSKVGYINFTDQSTVLEKSNLTESRVIIVWIVWYDLLLLVRPWAEAPHTKLFAVK